MNVCYPITFERAVAPGLGFGDICQINVLNEEFLIKSISYDVEIVNMADLSPLLLHNNINQRFYLDLFAIPPGYVFAHIYEGVVAAGAGVQNGTNIHITQPGQKFFKNFTMRNNLIIYSNYINFDALITFRYTVNIIIEIEYS